MVLKLSARPLGHYVCGNSELGTTRVYFSILKHILQDGGGVIRISHVDRTKILSYGEPSLGRYLCRLHIWRCTADFSACKDFYELMCAVEGVYEQWRQIVCSKPKPRWKFVQPNTFVNGDEVELRVYEASNEGIIQSWAERETQAGEISCVSARIKVERCPSTTTTIH
ncbi:peptidase family M49-domain-containing protein [Aspergillus transmontanensis]|uniref:Peptidase family M49-domain-containing protein n=1 Tax=Aspergillus transmontanensis TaxID=1034304 RepID=A0A5N6VXN6_9EURO|nr:peptidase family M49-domain-containing protein [Aspergillus transmontanensis]